MTTSRTSNDTLSLTDVALELFKTRSMSPGINPEQLAIDCFRSAKSFLAVSELVQSGEIAAIDNDTNPLDVACAPNLKKTHPVNLMSRAWGDVKKVESVLAELEADPSAESYEPFGWGRPEVNQARALFPAVVNRAQQYMTK